jgi:hypothetical protein
LAAAAAAVMDPNGLKTGGIDIFLYRTCCLILDILPMSLFLEFHLFFYPCYLQYIVYKYICCCTGQKEFF